MNRLFLSVFVALIVVYAILLYTAPNRREFVKMSNYGFFRGCLTGVILGDIHSGMLTGATVGLITPIFHTLEHVL